MRLSPNPAKARGRSLAGSLLFTGLLLSFSPVSSAWADDLPDYVPPGQQIRFQQEVARLAARPARPGGVVFVGSSIFREWKTVPADMRPLPAVNLAFGGSRTWEVLYYADRLVLPWRPRIIVYYCGSNDINAGQDAPGIARRFRLFVEHVHAQLPDTRIFFTSINRAPQKRDRWDVVDAANAAIAAYARRTPHVGFIDVNPALFDAQGAPRLDLYRADQLHFHPAAYREFAHLIKPVVQRAWREMIEAGQPRSGRSEGSGAPETRELKPEPSPGAS